MLHILRGWPARFVLLIGNPERAAHLVAEFRSDFERYSQLVGDKTPSDKVAKVLKHRSLFEIPPVQQYVAALQFRDWKIDQDFLDWETRRSSRIISSQIIEDDIHFCKAAMNVANNKLMSDLRMYLQPINKRIAETVHSYTSPDEARPPTIRTAGLPDEVFKAPPKARWTDFSTLKSSSPSVPWYSPPVDTMHVPIADLELARYLEASGKYDLVDNLDLVCLLRDRHDLVVRDTTGVAHGGSWLMPVAAIGTHCAIAWPVEVKKFSGPKPIEYVDMQRCTSCLLHLHVRPNDLAGQGLRVVVTAPPTGAMSEGGRVGAGALVHEGGLDNTGAALVEVCRAHSLR